MFDVGQGDSIFIESPTGVQILVDSGSSKNILNHLMRSMSPLDKSIDAIIITNPDADHIGGFVNVLENYKVNYVLEPGTYNDSKIYKKLQDEIKTKNITKILARRGMDLDLGGGVNINILFPDRDVSSWERNDGSIIMRLVYGENSIMLTGDATLKTENYVLGFYKKEELQSDILKVGHHGSRTSTGENFLKAVLPEYAVISMGKDNKYGHPHKEILDILAKFKVKTLRTDQIGTIVFSCDRIKPCEIQK